MSARRGMYRLAIAAGVLALAVTAAGADAAATPAKNGAPPEEPEIRVYDVLFDVRLLPTQRTAEVAFHLGEHDGMVKEIFLNTERDRHLEVKGAGTVETTDEGVRWLPPPDGGTLRYTFRIDHLRDERSYDARCAEDWAVFRADDLVPPLRVRTTKGARSDSRLRFRLPTDWSIVTPYKEERDGTFHVQRPERKFDRPVGWMVAGRLGVLRERIAGSRIAVAGPVGHGVRRLDIVAMLRWTLPTLREIVGPMPERLLVVSAGDPMWRGGLSGPDSVFLHADRPLISGDGTSPLLHELMHSLVPISSGGDGDDWIVEGLAERYSLQALVRSRTVSRKRHRKTLEKLEEKGASASTLRVESSSGAVTARAVGLLEELDGLLRESTKGARSLDDVVRSLRERPGKITTDEFKEIVLGVGGPDAKGAIEKVFRGKLLRARSGKG